MRFPSVRRAFTLVELLVVVGIIGVLVALLLPAASLVRNAASKLECANNLKNQGIALHSFMDVNGHFPPAKVNSGTDWYFGGVIPPAGPIQYPDLVIYPNGGGYVISTGEEFPPGTFPVGSPVEAGVHELGHLDYYGSGTYRIYNHSGFMMLLPYLELDELHRAYDYSAPASTAAHGTVATYSPSFMPQASQQNMDVICTYVRVYSCPADEDPIVDTQMSSNWSSIGGRAMRSNYVFSIYHANWEIMGHGPHIHAWVVNIWNSVNVDAVFPRGMFGTNTRHRVEDVADGLTNTIAIGETKQVGVSSFMIPTASHWGAAHVGSVTGAIRDNGDFAPGCLRLNSPTGAMAGPERGFSSLHTGGANFLFGDGTVRFLSDRISFAVYDAMGSIAGGENINVHLD